MNSIHAKPYGSAVLESEIVALRKENARLREALEKIESDARQPQYLYDKNGPQWTSPAGHEYEDTSAHLAFANEIAESARAALSGDKQPS